MADSAPLVLLTEFASGPSGRGEIDLEELERENWRSGMLRSREMLRNKAAELLPDYRVSTACQLPIIPNRAPEIWKDLDTGRAHIHGLAHCGSAWVCPVCAAKISMARRSEVKEALELAGKMGWKVLFVTLTASHGRDDPVDQLLDKFKAAKRYMRSGRKWQEVKDLYLVKGSITATEFTWGFANGWHVHFHEIFFIGGVTTDEVVEDHFYQLWSAALDREGLSCSRDRGVRVDIGTEKAGEYITKWGLDHELAGLGKAASRGHFTPFQLLALYAAGEEWAGYLFQQYADATKGKASMMWSRGLRDKLGMAEELTDQELAESGAGNNSVCLLRMTRKQYAQLLYSGRAGVIGEMLSVAESGRDALLIWLAELFDIHPEVPP